MATVKKRNPSDGFWTAFYADEHGIRRQKKAYSDKSDSLKFAIQLEEECRKIRDGIIDAGERTRKQAQGKPIKDHIADYRKYLAATDVGEKHVSHTIGVITRLLENSGVADLSALDGESLSRGLANLSEKKRSARTKNHAVIAVKAFVGWLADERRIAEMPRGVAKLGKYDEESDRRKVRRHLTEAEVMILLTATESGPTITRLAPRGRPSRKSSRGGDGRFGRKRSAPLSGPERAAIYRVAMGTGFRVNEMRSLTPESFQLEGDEPTITVKACYSKNGKLAIQPIARDLAELLRPIIASREPGKPVFAIPPRSAEMLREDMDRAGIKYATTGEGVVDFHSLRTSYVTHLIRSGANVKVAQRLARHSDPRLTISRYTTLEEGDLREAIERKK